MNNDDEKQTSRKASWAESYRARAPLWIHVAFLVVGALALGALTAVGASSVITAVGVFAAIFASVPGLMALEDRRQRRR